MCYIGHVKRTKINKKRQDLPHFLNDLWVDHHLSIAQKRRNWLFYWKWQLMSFLNMVKTRSLIVYFRPFLKTIIIKWKTDSFNGVDGMLGIRTRHLGMAGAYISTDLWLSPLLLITFTTLVYKMGWILTDQKFAKSGYDLNVDFDYWRKILWICFRYL